MLPSHAICGHVAHLHTYPSSSEPAVPMFSVINPIEQFHQQYSHPFSDHTPCSSITHFNKSFASISNSHVDATLFSFRLVESTAFEKNDIPTLKATALAGNLRKSVTRSLCWRVIQIQTNLTTKLSPLRTFSSSLGPSQRR